jgi:hypothetical protein
VLILSIVETPTGEYMCSGSVSPFKHAQGGLCELVENHRRTTSEMHPVADYFAYSTSSLKHAHGEITIKPSVVGDPESWMGNWKSLHPIPIVPIYMRYEQLQGGY